MVKTMLEMARQLFPLRNCNLKLSKENINDGKFKVCLEYHLGNCGAPCVGLQSEKDYMKSIDQVKELLKGNIKQVADQLNRFMKQYAEAFRFEEAQLVKTKLDMLEKYRSKSTVVNPRIKNTDVFSIIEENDIAVVNYLRVIDGAIIQAHSLEMKKKMGDKWRIYGAVGWGRAISIGEYDSLEEYAQTLQSPMAMAGYTNYESYNLLEFDETSMKAAIDTLKAAG